MHKRYLVTVVIGAMVVAGSLTARSETEDERVLRIIKPEMAQLRECYLRFAAVYGKSSCESAAVVADAVFAKCSPEEQRLSIALDLAAPYGKRGFNRSFVEGVREGGRPLILRAVLDARTEQVICSPQPKN